MTFNEFLGPSRKIRELPGTSGTFHDLQGTTVTFQEHPGTSKNFRDLPGRLDLPFLILRERRVDEKEGVGDEGEEKMEVVG